MTPAEWDLQIIPPHTTRHALSVSLGCKVFYRDDVTPHQEWNGMCWCDLGRYDCTQHTTPLDEPPYLHASKSYVSGKKDLSPIYTSAKYKGD